MPPCSHSRQYVVIDYTNYLGVRAKRTILPHKLEFRTSEWHPEPQWILEALDCTKGQYRDFAMSMIHSWEATEAPGAQSQPQQFKNEGEM